MKLKQALYLEPKADAVVVSGKRRIIVERIKVKQVSLIEIGAI